MKSFLAFCCSLIFLVPILCQVYPPPSNIYYENGTLTICPPDSVPGYTGGLLGYNVYIDDEFFENLPAGSPDDTVTIIFDPLPLPGYRTFCATANYVNWISDITCDTALVYFGYELPFTEDWSSGSFETNNWTQEGNYWIIDNESGEPMPSAKFRPSSEITNYIVPLTSYSFVADTIPLQFVLVEFDVKLESNSTTGNEKLLLQYWDWSSQSWHSTNCGGFTNADGSFDWIHSRCKFTALKSGPFMMRFAAFGANSSDITGWYIDNINIYQDCGAVYDLTTSINEEDKIELHWDLLGDCFYCSWCWIGYGQYPTGNSIGTGSATVFDVATRWTSDVLAEYEGEYITACRFFPAEAQATYSLRIWTGDSANLVYEQNVLNPLISQWNEICLDTIHVIDVTQDLWIGYHIETETGYPAGADDGPAYEDANMIFWDNQWQTLQDLNPELDFNWLIEAFPGQDYPKYCKNAIYKKVGAEDYDLIALVPGQQGYEYFTDEQVDLTQINCYKVTNQSYKNLDTCVSSYYTESCVLPVTIQEPVDGNDLQFYPNPASDELFINSSSEIIELEMIDITGRIIYIEKNLNSMVKIPVRDFSAGIYLLKISLEDTIVFRKVLIN